MNRTIAFDRGYHSSHLGRATFGWGQERRLTVARITSGLPKDLPSLQEGMTRTMRITPTGQLFRIEPPSRLKRALTALMRERSRRGSGVKRNMARKPISRRPAWERTQFLPRSGPRPPRNTDGQGSESNIRPKSWSFKRRRFHRERRTSSAPEGPGGRL